MVLLSFYRFIPDHGIRYQVYTYLVPYWYQYRCHLCSYRLLSIPTPIMDADEASRLLASLRMRGADVEALASSEPAQVQTVLKDLGYDKLGDRARTAMAIASLHTPTAPPVAVPAPTEASPAEVPAPPPAPAPLPPAPPPAAPRDKVVCTVRCNAVTLKLTLTAKLLSRSFTDALLTPFLGAYNKKKTSSLTTSDLTDVQVDGVSVDVAQPTVEILSGASHQIVLLVAHEADQMTAPSAGDATSTVERVLSAADEFAVLELPLHPVGQAAVRKAYRRVSLLVHPDKVNHPRASEAFRRCFDAMKLLIDERRQAARLRQIQSGNSSAASDGESQLPSDTRWWDAASVGDMEQAFRNLEEYLEAQGAFGEAQLDQNLWTAPAEAERLRRSGLAFFVDARDTGDYSVCVPHLERRSRSDVHGLAPCLTNPAAL